MTITEIISVRAGSRRLKNKNTAPLVIPKHYRAAIVCCYMALKEGLGFALMTVFREEAA